MIKLKQLPVGGLFQYENQVCVKSNEKDCVNGNFYCYAVVISPKERGRDLRIEDKTFVSPLGEYLIK